MKIQYKEKIIEIPQEISIQELLKDEIENSKYAVVGAIFNNNYVNLDYKIKKDGKIKLIDVSSKEGSKIYRTTLVYILSKAFEEMYPEEKLEVDYQLTNSMFCDVENFEITDEFIEKLSRKMKEIVEKDLPIKQVVMNREEAKRFYEENNTAKGRLQYDIKENQEIYMYFCDDYFNYCYSTLANRTGVAKIFELVKYEDGFLMRYPSSQEPNQLPKLVETKKLAWALDE